jgi:hypothetical protein
MKSKCQVCKEKEAVGPVPVMVTKEEPGVTTLLSLLMCRDCRELKESGNLPPIRINPDPKES